MHIHYGRVLAGGFLIEIVLLLVLAGGFAAAGVDLANGVSPLSAVIIGAGCFVGAFGIAWWLSGGIQRQRVLHGLLMGIVATLIYVGLIAGTGQMAAALAAYGPTTFVVVNGLRVVGAVLGGMAAERKRAVPARAEHAAP